MAAVSALHCQFVSLMKLGASSKLKVGNLLLVVGIGGVVLVA